MTTPSNKTDTPDSGMTTTQWGNKVRSFADYSEDEKQTILTTVRDTIRRASEISGIEIYLSYGALLGAVRNGRLIGHDFDLDLVFISPDSNVVSNSKALIEALTEAGCTVAPYTNGQFKVFIRKDGKSLLFEIFASWFEKDKFYQYFTVNGEIDRSDVLPLSSIEVEGVAFPCPRNPVRLLEVIYGEGWKVPDPNFKYEMAKGTFTSFQFLFAKKNQKHWNDFYSGKLSGTAAPEAPSNYARLVADQLGPNARILDFGCGSGRDSNHFARVGADVTVCDYSASAIEFVTDKGKEEGLEFKSAVVDVTNNVDVVNFRNKNEASFDAVYARFFVHAINDDGRRNFFDIAKGVLDRNGTLFLEFRIRPDTMSQKEYESQFEYAYGKHFRQLNTLYRVVEELKELGFTITEQESGNGLAVHKDEDPLIGRITATLTS